MVAPKDFQWQYVGVPVTNGFRDVPDAARTRTFRDIPYEFVKINASFLKTIGCPLDMDQLEYENQYYGQGTALDGGGG